MKLNLLLYTTACSLLLFGACSPKETMETPDDRTLEYSLDVTNDDYTATTVLDGIGNTRIKEVLNQPAWVGEVKREENLLGGSMVLAVTVKADPSLDEIRRASLTIKMTNGATAILELAQRAGLPVGFNAGESPSENKDFEADWSSVLNIDLVTSVQKVNDREQVIMEPTPLPWNFGDPGTKSNIPDDELESMLTHKKNWVMAFNTTGIRRSSCVNLNYFGLYNVSTGKLRIFYYWPASLIPESGANDHLWYVGLKGTQAEHNSTQFAIPVNHKMDKGTDAYKTFEKKAGTYYTTALTDEMNPDDSYVIVPKIGWWAFDMDLSAMRSGSFFDDYKNITIGMDLFDSQNIIMTSLIQGGLSGKLTGGMDLQGLLPASTNDAGKVVPNIASAASSFLTNKFVLDYFFSGAAAGGGGGGGAAAAILPRFAVMGGVIAVGIGCLISMAGNIGKEYAKEGAGADVKKTLGSMDVDVSLDLNATMNTKGLIRSQRSHKVPEVSIPIEYMRNLTGTSEGGSTVQAKMGKGLWNITEDPVVYFVKDAYWANKPQVTYYSRKNLSWYRTGQEMAEYDISMSPYQLGMRLISFFDPTSIGNVVINEDIFGVPTEVNVSVSYGIYPGSEPGYTDLFRTAVSMGYKPYTISTSDKKDKVSTGTVAGAAKAPFRVFKAPYNKDIFIPQFSNPYPETIALRLSSQDVNTEKFERRYYGNSLFYENPRATYSTVDNVQFVADPQIFLPYDESRRVITDPDIPDLVISVNVLFRSQGPLEDEPTWKTYTLRYLPKVQFIGVNEVKGIADKIVAKPNGGLPSNYHYVTLDTHRKLVQSFSTEISAQLSK